MNIFTGKPVPTHPLYMGNPNAEHGNISDTYQGRAREIKVPTGGPVSICYQMLHYIETVILLHMRGHECPDPDENTMRAWWAFHGRGQGSCSLAEVLPQIRRHESIQEQLFFENLPAKMHDQYGRDRF